MMLADIGQLEGGGSGRACDCRFSEGVTLNWEVEDTVQPELADSPKASLITWRIEASFQGLVM